MNPNHRPYESEIPDPEGLRALALELIGTFTSAQELIVQLARWHVERVSSTVAVIVSDRLLDRMSDQDRMRWLRAVVKDTGVEGVPLERLESAFASAKAVRDHIAHSPSTAPVWNGKAWRLAVAYDPAKSARAQAVGDLDAQVLRAQIDRVRWLIDWVIWTAAESGYTRTILATGQEVDVERPSSSLPRS